MILRSASEKYFCVGANINALRTLDAETIVPWVKSAGTRSSTTWPAYRCP